jgi:predicted transcriptional regulator
MRKYTKRDLVHMEIMRVSGWEFQVRDIHACIEDEYDREVSKATVEGVIHTLRDEGLLKHSEDGKHFKRDF